MCMNINRNSPITVLDPQLHCQALWVDRPLRSVSQEPRRAGSTSVNSVNSSDDVPVVAIREPHPVIIPRAVVPQIVSVKSWFMLVLFH